MDHQGELLTEGFKILKDETSILKDVIEAKQIEIRPLASHNQHASVSEQCENTNKIHILENCFLIIS